MIAVACVVLAVWAALAGRRAAPGPTLRLSAPQRHPRRARRSIRPWSRRPSGLPEAVDAVASALRAGRSLADALVTAAAATPNPLASELTGVATAIGRGLPSAVAVERWSTRTTEPGAPLFAAAIGLAGDAGGDVGGALAGVADTLRERRALGREIRALAAQARLSALIVAVAPVGFAVVAALADPETARFLLATPAGLACLVIGAALDLAGWRWMRHITGAVR